FENSWVRQDGTAIACCNDGLRPVYFRLEATDEDVTNPFNMNFYEIK
ncbi:MAG: TIGR04076 family protein, partial [Muribaculaceae bacterium]|nr:TIGR04076 family protein [Muribaculaceae bacterium]